MTIENKGLLFFAFWSAFLMEVHALMWMMTVAQIDELWEMVHPMIMKPQI